MAMQIGPKNNHFGRQRRSIFKNSHIEVVLKEVKGLSAKKKDVKKDAESTKEESKKTKTKDSKVKNDN
jgi:hypothetical protein